MKRALFTMVGVLWLASMAFGQISPLDSLENVVKSEFRAQPYPTSTDFKTIDQLHQWFLIQEQNLQMNHPGSRVLFLGAYSAQYMGPRIFRPNWVFSFEGQYPLYTKDVAASIFSMRLGEKSAINLRARFGQGFDKITGLNDRAQSMYGFTGRFSFLIWKRFNPMLGIDYAYVNMKKTKNGEALFPWVGVSSYIFHNVSLDLKAGRSFWSGFATSRPTSDWYGMAALSYHQTPILTKAGRPWLGGLETTVNYNLELESVRTHIGVPIRLFNELSLMPYMSIGSGVREMNVATHNRITLHHGGGLELRMFGDYLKKLPDLNTYIAADYNVLQMNNFRRKGAGWAILIGDRMRIRNRIDLDVNTGLAFWRKDFPGGDKNKPDVWMINVGLNYRWGAPQKNPRYIKGVIMTVPSEWGKSYQLASEKRMDVLPSDSHADQVSEIRVFSIDKKPVVPPPVYVPKEEFGDVSDLKFFSINLDMKIKVDPFNDKDNLLNNINNNDKDILIAVLFNRNKVKVNRLDSKNMLFHFEDVENGQYFGYRWDRNRLRVPEYRHYDHLGYVDSSKYMGAYDEFVKPLHWLDNEEVLGIPGNYIEKKILQVMDKGTPIPDSSMTAIGPTVGPLQNFEQNYRVAVVRYKLSTIKKMRRFLADRDFAVAVKFQKDMDGDGCYLTLKNAQIVENRSEYANLNPDSTIVGFDNDDVFFFSNHVKTKDIRNLNKVTAGNVIKKVAVYGFGLCNATLPASEKKKIDRQVIPLLKAENIQVDLVGYADATPLRKKCLEKYGQKNGQVKLSYARAKTVKDYLIAKGVDGKKIVIRGAGVFDPLGIHQPKHRRVEIIVLNVK